ncbi:MAG: PRC-barrel domain containing protein [Gammaproteobacteria bacterium]|jgi:hypothetical protein|nr:PRC-barrel domain containing protein [Gammaproteobacteria bacterium]
MNDSKFPSDIVSSRQVVGVAVKSPAEEDLGKIEEIMLDKFSGTVRYAVLSFGGFLGMGDKLFAIPWKSFSYNPEFEAFILNVSKEKLENAPGFDKDHWPNANDLSWSESISKYYDV